MSQYATRCSDVSSRILENGKLGLCSNVFHVFHHLIHERNSGVKGEEYDTTKLTDQSTRTGASKMHVGDSVVRTLPAKTGSAARPCKILNFVEGPVHVSPETGFTATTSDFMHVLPARAFRRHQKAIRSRSDCISWFSSLNSGPMEAPPSSPNCYSHTLQGGDLFVHTHDRGHKAWMWGESGWMPVQEGHSHPSIAGYYLSIAGSGEPSWVTGKTMATYRSKNRKCFP
ncbi:hypothetical protein EDD16DRAFT_300509 [Pisolithus croceorrhizus]|nr:hypothetical protein EDD16DRAFT_300509 [Pisolithus croceorrhizus]